MKKSRRIYRIYYGLDLKIESIKVDGQRGTLRAIREVLIETQIQRCLVHIQRQSLIWLTNGWQLPTV